MNFIQPEGMIAPGEIGFDSTFAFATERSGAGSDRVS
jgi:hypothetical protein